MEILIKELSPFGPLSPCKEHVDDVRMLGYHDEPQTAALSCTCNMLSGLLTKYQTISNDRLALL